MFTPMSTASTANGLMAVAGASRINSAGRLLTTLASPPAITAMTSRAPNPSPAGNSASIHQHRQQAVELGFDRRRGDESRRPHQCGSGNGNDDLGNAARSDDSNRQDHDEPRDRQRLLKHDEVNLP